MEFDKNPMPEFDLGLPDPIARIKKISTCVLHFFTQHHSENRGGGPALDAALYDQPAQLEFQYDGE